MKFESLTTKFIKNLIPLSAPNYMQCIIYLTPALYLFIANTFLKNISTLSQRLLFLSFVILLGTTFAYKDLEPYIHKVNTLKNTLKISIILIFTYGIIEYPILTIVGQDPQSIANSNLNLNNFLSRIILLPLIAISEEIIKALMLLSFIKLFKSFKSMGIILSIVLSSIVFGLLHIQYNFSNTIQIIISIGCTSIPSFLFLLYYKSIYPPIIVHFIIDFFTICKMSSDFSFIPKIFELIITISALIFILLSVFKTTSKH